jgi:Ca2+-binding RTX toxin-like protein
VARRDGTAWHEIVGGARPINVSGSGSASEPQIAFLDGTPYVAYLQDNPPQTSIGVVRLTNDGSAWERVDPPAGADARPRMASSGGRLYVAKSDRLGPGALVYRLKADRTGWESLGALGVPDHAFFGDIADAGGAPAALFATEESNQLTASTLDSADTWQPLGGGPILTSDSRVSDPQAITALAGVPYAAWLQGGAGAHIVQVAYVKDGAWTQAPSPSSEGADAGLARLAASTTGVYLLWSETPAGGASQVHVARLGEPTDPLVPPSDPGAGADGGDTSGGSTGPTPVPTGSCANAIAGTAFSDILRGTRASDSISGGAGNDRLFGFAGDDCLFGDGGNDSLAGGHGADEVHGGAGNDLVTGGTEADKMFGGPGRDELHGGPGNDDLNGGGGNDVIFAGPGQDGIGAGAGNDRIYVHGGGSDLVACGGGHDTALIDRDDATRGCERVIVRR